MKTPSEFLHTLTALALTAPILAFYVVIASEAFGWRPTERAMLITPTALASACAAYAKGK